MNVGVVVYEVTSTKSSVVSNRSCHSNNGNDV